MNNSDTLDTLNTLIETSKDGEYGFRTSAEYLRRPDLKQSFMTRAEECRAGAAELQDLVQALGGDAESGGSAAGAVHRGWVAVKGKLSGYDDAAILNETERGEDVAMSAYQRALDGQLPANVHSVVARQYEGVKRNHAQVRMLRDEARNDAT